MLERRQSLLQYCNVVKLQDWFAADHGSHTPLQDEGEEPRMDLVNAAAPVYAPRGLDMCTETLNMYTEIRCRIETDSCQC